MKWNAKVLCAFSKKRGWIHLLFTISWPLLFNQAPFGNSSSIIFYICWNCWLLFLEELWVLFSRGTIYLSSTTKYWAFKMWQISGGNPNRVHGNVPKFFFFSFYIDMREGIFCFYVIFQDQNQSHLKAIKEIFLHE